MQAIETVVSNAVHNEAESDTKAQVLDKFLESVAGIIDQSNKEVVYENANKDA